MGSTVLQCQCLSKYYGRRRAIEDVNLAVEQGEVFGYLGPNGAGKTSTIRIVLDFIRASAGSALVFGLDSRQASQQIHSRVGYLAGELFLYDNLTCGQFFRFLASLHGGVEWAFVEELAARLSCDLSMPIKSLSQGNKRKVGLIQAFMHRPALLILDEPTNGLDPLIQQAFYRLVAEAKMQGQTIFLSSHNLAEVERICDRVAIIRSGKIVAVETVASLRARSLRLVEIHFAGPVPLEAIRGISNLQIFASENSVLKCRVQGSMDPLLKAIAPHAVNDLISQQPSLEESFLAFYGG